MFTTLKSPCENSRDQILGALGNPQESHPKFHLAGFKSIFQLQSDLFFQVLPILQAYTQSLSSILEWSCFLPMPSNPSTHEDQSIPNCAGFGGEVFKPGSVPRAEALDGGSKTLTFLKCGFRARNKEGHN